MIPSTLVELEYPLPPDAFGELESTEFIIAVGFLANGHVVFVHPAGDARGWELPGGAFEPGESAIAAGQREFREETGRTLDRPLEVARIRNLRVDGRVHSHAWLIAGLAGSQEQAIFRDEILACETFADIPPFTTFDADWVRHLILLAQTRLEVQLSQRLWNETSECYNTVTVSSTTEVHYGPLLPGESRLRLLPDLRGARVLDVGCGSGHNLAAMRYAGAAAGLGIDLSAEQVERARRLLNDPAFIISEADVMNPPYLEAGSFDVALSIYALQFVADLKPVIAWIGHGLRPGGTFVIAIDHPCRVGCWRDNRLEIDDWFNVRTRIRDWSILGRLTFPYFHRVHSLPTLVDALVEAELQVDRILEPQALPHDELDAAPQSSPYFLSRYEEMRRVPYAIVVRARKAAA